uniref:EC70 protein n=1 Tax=Colletotrichum higginsianum TaxID=80884 RepID=I2G7F0_9PEZI|nr:EC70 protein [Colletotrichum higginsianum]
MPCRWLLSAFLSPPSRTCLTVYRDAVSPFSCLHPLQSVWVYLSDFVTIEPIPTTSSL